MAGKHKLAGEAWKSVVEISQKCGKETERAIFSHTVPGNWWGPYSAEANSVNGGFGHSPPWGDFLRSNSQTPKCQCSNGH